jgi:hypothetical protein
MSTEYHHPDDPEPARERRDEPPSIDECPPNSPEGIQVAGRGWHKPYVRVSVQGTCFVLSVHDELHPELWMHVHISEDIVEQWARFAALRPCDTEGEVTEPPDPVTE